jgi:hypothetical protein
MTKFEDRLFGQLMTEHGHQLRTTPQPAAAPRPARRLARRPVWLAGGAAAVAGAATAAALALGSAPAYAVTQDGGTTSVSVYSAAGVAGANAALRKVHARVRVVPVRAGCPAIGSLPRPHPAPHLGMSTASRLSKSGHRGVTVKLTQGGIPKGDTLILAFSGGRGDSLGAGGIITGPVPHCVSLPSAP